MHKCEANMKNNCILNPFETLGFGEKCGFRYAFQLLINREGHMRCRINFH